MEIKYSEGKYLEGLKCLWKEAFSEDGDSFVDFYFENKYKDNNTLIILCEDEVISSLQNLEYDFLYKNKNYKVGYISGACTKKEFRGAGYMKKLLAKALTEDYKNNRLFSCLIPADSSLFEYYKKSGYRTSFYVDKTQINNPSADIKPVIAGFTDFESYYKNKISDGWVYLCKKNLEDYKKYFELCGGVIVRYDDKFAVLLKNGNRYDIPYSDIDKNILSRSLGMPADIKSSGEESPYAMMRITNVRMFIEMIKDLIPENIPVRITDDIISENNICFVKTDGEINFCSEYKYQLKVEEIAEKISCFKMFLMMD